MNPKRIYNDIRPMRTTLRVVDSGVLAGAENMAIDRAALDAMLDGRTETPTLRFFQWDKFTASYGYLLNEGDVTAWAKGFTAIQRPTGGGAVLHRTTDLSVSLLWPRRRGILPEAPRACYAAVHEILKEGVDNYLDDKRTHLYSKPTGNCEAPEIQKQFSVCFEKPVCNDVMLGHQKVVGGALRVTRTAILYQGTIQLNGVTDFDYLKNCLLKAFQRSFDPLPAQEPAFAGRA